MTWNVEKKSNALKDICQLEKHHCTRHVKSAYRKFMPQLDTKEMKSFAKKGVIAKKIIQSKLDQTRLNKQQRKILQEICDTCKTKNVDVPIRLDTIRVSELTVTQNEANIEIVNAIASRLTPATSRQISLQEQIELMTKENPIIVSKDNKVIDGHHRFHAIKRLKRDAVIHIIRLGVSHYHAMVISWALSKGTHSF